jgi:AraC-like DNA-binding protein
MRQKYMDNLKSESVWLVAQSHEVCDHLAFCPREAGCFTLSGDSGEIHCGREDYLLLYAFSGKGELLYDGKWQPLPAHSLAMIDCRRPYALRAEQPWSFYWLRFAGEACEALYDTVNGDSFTSYEATDPLRVETEFSSILELFSQPGVDAYFRLSHSISLLMTLLVDLKFTKSSKRNRHRETIALATRYIQENYTTSLDIDQLAQQARLSKYYFIKLFKEFMNVAPYEYIILYRINEAKKYLRATTMKISQVSDAVGFNDECNFIRTFKRLTGFTPLQYRDSQR